MYIDNLCCSQENGRGIRRTILKVTDGERQAINTDRPFIVRVTNAGLSPVTFRIEDHSGGRTFRDYQYGTGEPIEGLREWIVYPRTDQEYSFNPGMWSVVLKCHECGTETSCYAKAEIVQQAIERM